MRAGRAPAQLRVPDASWLLQRGGGHMQIGGVAISHGPAPAYEELREHISERSGWCRAFAQKHAHVPVALSRPWWVDDPHFSLEYRLRHSGLPRPGSTGQLKALIARVFSQRLDRSVIDGCWLHCGTALPGKQPHCQQPWRPSVPATLAVALC